MKQGQILGGFFLILSGVALLVGSMFGFGNIWPIWPIGIGVVIMLFGGYGKETPKQRLNRQQGGAWVTLTGIVFTLVYFFGPKLIGPLYMIGGGLITLVFQLLRSKVGGGADYVHH